eukprot:6181895-Pleurochrysis_carterae.AAC.1
MITLQGQHGRVIERINTCADDKERPRRECWRLACWVKYGTSGAHQGDRPLPQDSCSFQTTYGLQHSRHFRLIIAVAVDRDKPAEQTYTVARQSCFFGLHPGYFSRDKCAVLLVWNKLLRTACACCCSQLGQLETLLSLTSTSRKFPTCAAKRMSMCNARPLLPLDVYANSIAVTHNPSMQVDGNST